MQSTMRRRHCKSLENVDVEQQQQSLFDISVFKLQREQIKRGADLKLLHFVLVNNALKTLQVHMHHFDDCDDGDGDGGGEDDGGGGGGKLISSYIYNTFKHDSLSSIPLSPPTPMKTVKTDSSFSDQSPLVEYLEASPGGIMDDTIITSLEGERVQPAATLHEADKEEYREMEVADESTKDRRMLNGFAEGHGIQLGKRTRDHFEEEDDGNAQGDPRGHLIEGVGGGVALCEVKEGSRVEGDLKRHCKSPGMQKGLNVLNNPQAVLELDPLPPPVLPSSPTSLISPQFHHHHTYQSHGGEESDKGSPTPSPIDFTNVDPSIYDFDAAVLGEDSPASVLGGCTDHASSQANSLLPCHINSTSGPSSSSGGSGDFSTTASYSSTTQSTVHSSFSPLSSAVSVSCPPPSQGKLIETPHVFSPLPSCPPSSVGLSSSPQTNGDGDYINLFSSIIEPKLSVLSAESTVLTAVSSASAVTTTAAGVKGSSCSLQALVRNGDLVSDEEISNKLSQTSMSLSNGSTNSLTLSPEAGIEADDDLGCIVDMLMT